MRGVRLIVNGGSVVVEPGADASNVVEAVKRHQNTTHVQRSRSRAVKSK